jgi:hypothetical protein
MEIDLQAGDAGKCGPLLSPHFNTTAYSECSTMEMKMAPVTPLLFAEKPTLPMVDPQATGPLHPATRSLARQGEAISA